MNDKQMLSSKCRNLLKEYSDVLEHLIDEIRREQDSPINAKTTDEIALEYQRRTGVKNGLTLLMQKINTKADVRD